MKEVTFYERPRVEMEGPPGRRGERGSEKVELADPARMGLFALSTSIWAFP